MRAKPVDPLVRAEHGRERITDMIRLRDIEKCYDNRAGKTFVLRRINLDFEGGEFVTIIRPSAAGKTTLLNILGMFDGEWNGLIPAFAASHQRALYVST